MDQFLPVFETAETGDGLQDVGIAVVFGRQNVRLDHRHHGQFQFQFPSSTTSAASYYPRVAVNFGQLTTIETQKKKCIIIAFEIHDNTKSQYVEPTNVHIYIDYHDKMVLKHVVDSVAFD